jgi:TaqI-like C-terminal specificity domain/Eco57I restriction-modification methylase
MNLSGDLGEHMPRTGFLNDEQAHAGASGLHDSYDSRASHGWYEAGLPSMERKKRGHYSTPPPLVEQILDACGYTPGADLTRVRVLDPACGSGNFLVGAARRLLASARRLGCSQQEQARLLERNIWGFDPDPVSCLLARMQLSSPVVGTRFIASSSPTDSQLPGRDQSRPYDGHWHVHQADSLAMPWEPCVDLFLANPPYLAAKNSDLSGYRLAQQRGQVDSYLLFLSLAMQVVRPEGWVGLVLPDPVLARLNAARERAQFLRQMTLHNIWHLSAVFSAEVGAVVLVAQHVPPATTHQVAWVRARWQPSRPCSSTLSPDSSRSSHLLTPSQPAAPLKAQIPQDAQEALEKQGAQRVAQALLLRQPSAELRYLLSGENGALLEHLRVTLEDAPDGERRLTPLGDLVRISRGEELGRESQFITRREDTPTCAVLRGGIDIRPYAAPHAGWRIDHEAVTKPMERYLAPKLLVVKSTDLLQAALDTRGHVALQTLYLLHLREQHGSEDAIEALYFLLALLNSRLLREYVYVLHTAYKLVQPQIEQRVLAALPIPLAGLQERRAVIEKAKELERLCSKAGAVVEWNEEISAHYEALERAIHTLYIRACSM